MHLWEFMNMHRRALLEACTRKLQDRRPDRSREEHQEHLPAFLEEVIGALKSAAGSPESSPLPGPSAARAGHAREAQGYPVSHLAMEFGALSDALGEVAGAAGENFSAWEYRIFNLCVDTSVATALDRFWDDARNRQDTASGERLGFLAHELRNALSAATMAFWQIRHGHVGTEGRTSEVMRRALARMEHLIHQTLAAARLQGGAALHREDLDVLDLLRHVQAASVRERGVSVVVDVPPGLRVVADDGLATSAIGNLVHNAVKFTRDGGTIHVRARRQDEPRTASGAEAGVVIEVEDECGGLPPGRLEHLFQPFVQAGEDRRRGVGLGLAIARDAMRAHGGDIEVEDRPGKGCVFRLVFPAAAPDEPR